MLRAVLILLITAWLTACATVAAPPPDKRIAITFDDIPRHAGQLVERGERAAMLRAALREAGVQQAAFFLNPASLNDRPEAVADILAYVADGHVLANHSNSHPRLSQTDTQVFIADVDAAEAWISQLDGHRPWFRFPFLDEGGQFPDKRDALRAALADRRLLNAGVSVNASDWYIDDAANKAAASGLAIDQDRLRRHFVGTHVEAARFYDDLARRTFGRSPAHVLLLHETDTAAMYVDDLVRALEAEGWTIIPADEAFADPIYRLRPETGWAGGTIVEQVAWERGIEGERWFAGNRDDVMTESFAREVLNASSAAGTAE